MTSEPNVSSLELSSSARRDPKFMTPASCEEEGPPARALPGRSAAVPGLAVPGRNVEEVPGLTLAEPGRAVAGALAVLAVNGRELAVAGLGLGGNKMVCWPSL